jgi:hypothetical protein
MGSKAMSLDQTLLGVRKILLTQFYLTLVDEADFDWLAKWKWSIDRCGRAIYATRSRGDGAKVRMHREILGAEPGLLVDHINGNCLNNRRANLRICTHSENLRNTRARGGSSRFKGVGWHKHRGKWTARIVVAGRRIALGYYADELAAAAAYDAAAITYFGEFARLNFPKTIHDLKGKSTCL